MATHLPSSNSSGMPVGGGHWQRTTTPVASTTGAVWCPDTGEDDGIGPMPLPSITDPADEDLLMVFHGIGGYPTPSPSSSLSCLSFSSLPSPCPCTMEMGDQFLQNQFSEYSPFPLSPFSFNSDIFNNSLSVNPDGSVCTHQDLGKHWTGLQAGQESQAVPGSVFAGSRNTELDS